LAVDTKSATGKLILTIFAGFAQFEREMMLERQREGIVSPPKLRIRSNAPPSSTASSSCTGRGGSNMAKSKRPASEHHHQAATHHHAAAHHHHEAANHHDLGEHKEAKEHGDAAHEYSGTGHKHTTTAHEHSHK
jgi:hypothetical protein